MRAGMLERQRYRAVVAKAQAAETGKAKGRTGLAEAVAFLWPAGWGAPPIQWMAAVTIVLVTALAGRSAELSLKLQIPIMIAVGLSVVALILGVLTGGIGSRDASALPGRLSWSLGLDGMALAVRARHECCITGELKLRIEPGFGRVLITLPPSQGTLARWPTAWLAGMSMSSRFMVSLKAVRSSPRWMASTLTPITLTP